MVSLKLPETVSLQNRSTAACTSSTDTRVFFAVSDAAYNLQRNQTSATVVTLARTKIAFTPSRLEDLICTFEGPDDYTREVWEEKPAQSKAIPREAVGLNYRPTQ